MEVTKLDFIGVPSRDAERSRRFYGETFDTPVCTMALFEDPDGNDLMLHHRFKPYGGAEHDA